MEGPDLLERLPEAARRLLSRVGELAAARREPTYLVGGTVRDLILDRPNEDLDVVVVGEGMAVAQALARDQAGQLTRHHVFQTATVELAGGWRVDFATARGEDYPTPGQLPRVQAGSLEEDLARRDFTINAVALGLPPSAEPRIVDPFAGRADIEAGLVRILHERSFVDDPTRMLRAVRFALRFGYRLEDRTAVALADAVRGHNLDSISGDRLRRDVAKGLSEAPVRGPLALHEHGLLQSLHEDLEADAERLDRLQVEIGRYRDSLEPGDPAPDPVWALTLALVARRLAPQSRWELVRRLKLSRQERQPLLETGAPLAAALERLTGNREPGRADVVEALEDLSDGALLVAMAVLEESRQGLRAGLRQALLEDRRVRPSLRGDELLEMGCPPGERVGGVLRQLRRARLEGRVGDEAQERALARRLIEDAAN